MMVDAQIAALTVVSGKVTKKLNACNVYRHDVLRLVTAVVKAELHIFVARRNGVGTKNRNCFSKCFQSPVKRPGRAEGVAVRVFMTKQQDIVRRDEAGNRHRYVKNLTHAYINSFPGMVLRRTSHRCRRTNLQVKICFVITCPTRPCAVPRRGSLQTQAIAGQRQRKYSPASPQRIASRYCSLSSPMILLMRAA